MLRAIILSLSLLYFSAAQAAPETTAKSVPSYLHVYSSTGGVYVDMPPVGCSGARYVLSPSHPLFKEIFSILLASQMAKKQVTVRFDGCNSSNQGQIIGVYLEE